MHDLRTTTASTFLPPTSRNRRKDSTDYGSGTALDPLSLEIPPSKRSITSTFASDSLSHEDLFGLSFRSLALGSSLAFSFLPPRILTPYST